MLVGLSPQYLQWMLIAWATLIAFVFAAAFLRPWRSPRKPIRTLFKLSFSLWMLAFAAVAAETLFVSLYSTTDAFSLSLISKRWNERFVERNNWNCRDRKRYEGEIPAGMKRLAIVGDSFAFGHGIKNIKDRFGDLIAERLNKEAKDRWEVYNLAEPGAYTGWEVKRLEELGRKENFRADIVLLAYCLNDLEDLVPGTYEIVGSIINDPPKNNFCQQFYLPNFLYYRVNHFRRPEVRGYFGWLKDGHQGEIWEKQKQRLDQIKKWCDERNAKLVVVVFPFMVGLDESYTFKDAHQALTTQFKAMGTRSYDLLSIFSDAHRLGTSLTVNPFDAHPNEAAHSLAATKIWQNLLKDLVQ
jgi:hypothetical protein